MILKIGANALAQAEVKVRRIQKQSVIGSRGTFISTRERWFIQGRVRANTPAALKTAVDTRKGWFSQSDYDRDVEFFFNDGSTTTGDKLTAANTLNGVVISSVVWGEPQISPMTEWLYYRGYSLMIDAEFPVSGNPIISYNETVMLIGDGSSDYEILEYLIEPPDSQITKLYTKLAFRQWGAAIGLTAYPSYPTPVGVPKPHSGIQLGQSAPRQVGRKKTLMYPIQWSYYGEGPVAFGPWTFGP